MHVRLLIAVVIVLAALASPTRAVHADPLKPTLAEVNAVEDVLRFRIDMIADPDKAVRAFTAGAGSGELDTIAGEMADAGGGKAGWRFLLGTSVFAVTGLNAPRTLVVFYNPWVDTALFTVWQAQGAGRRIVEAEWVPGDLVRQAGAEIDPQPLWLRGRKYRPAALADAVVDTVKAIETRFAEPQIMAWRDTLGIKDGRIYHRLVAPIVAHRLYETQMRLKALALPTDGEDPKLMPLRTAVAGLIKTARSEGFKQPLAEARDTTAPMRKALGRVHPYTMRRLAPVAFVAGDGHATVFLQSSATADFMISARYAERVSGYALQQLEYVPYAATYQAAAGPAAAPVPAVSAPARPQRRSDPIGSVTRTSTFDRARGIHVGKSIKGTPVCFFREEGSSHKLDIGIGSDGAFIRVEHGDGPLPPEAVPTSPLQLFAGKAMTKLVDGDEKQTGEYKPLRIFGGSIDYISNLVTGFGSGFVVVSQGDPEAFLEIVALARGEFMVVQSASDPNKTDVVAVYKFTTKSVPTLSACARKHVR